MTPVLFVAGHGAGDPGAVGNGFTEAALVRKLAARIGELGGGPRRCSTRAATGTPTAG